MGALLEICCMFSEHLFKRTLIYLFIIIIIIYLMLTFVTYKWNINNLENTMIVKITTLFSIANLSQRDTLMQK